MRTLPIETLMLFGAIGATVIVLLATLNWRRAVHAAFVMALFEGAIRKWIVPEASELVYFLKDFILLGAYVRFYMFPESEIRGWKLQIPGGLIAALCFMVVVAGALNPNIGSILLAGYGIKIYLWYVPLAFMMPYLFRNEQHMTQLIFRYSLLSIPICLLGFAQFVAGPDSWLNVYARSSYIDVQQVATFGSFEGGERARITGTFSYISGHSVFVILFFGISLAVLSGISDKRRWIIMAGNLPLLAGNALMAGSRSAVFSMLIMAAAFVMVSSVSRVGKGSHILPFLAIAAGVMMLGINLFFSEAYDAFETRRRNTGDSVFERVLYPVNSVVMASKEVGLSGFGIGMSHPASDALRNALRIPPPKERCPVYDAETGQVLAELGWPGFLIWYFFRTMIVFNCWNAFRVAKPSAFRTLALIFFCFNALILPGSMILNHTANFFAFASWGFCLIPKLTPLVSQRRAPHGTESLNPAR